MKGGELIAIQKHRQIKTGKDRRKVTKVQSESNLNLQRKAKKTNNAEKEDSNQKTYLDTLLNVNTHETTDTGSEVIMKTSPLQRQAAKVAVKTTYKSVKVVRKVAKDIKNTDLKETLGNAQIKNHNSNNKQQSIKTSYTAPRRPQRQVLYERQEIPANKTLIKYRAKIKTIRARSMPNIKRSSIPIFQNIAPRKNLQLRSLKEDTSHVNKRDTSNTGYETIQGARVGIRKAENTVIGIENTIKRAKNINQYINKIKTGKVSDPYSKRTIRGNNARTTPYQNFRMNSARISSYETFKTNNAMVNKNETDNTGYEVIQEARVGIRKGTNIHRGTKNVRTFSRKIHSRYTNRIKTGVQKRKLIPKPRKIQQVVSKITEIAAQAIRKMVATMLTSKVGIIALLTIIPVMVIISIVASVAGGGLVGFTYIMAEKKTILEAKETVEELNENATKYIQILKQGDYDDIVLNGPSEITVNFQDILAIIGVENEQEYPLNQLESLHSKFYDIDSRTEVYLEWEKVGERTRTDSDGTTTTEDVYDWVEKIRLIINVSQYNVVKVINEVEFNEEQQEWAMYLANCDLLEIYPELAEFGIKKPEQGVLTAEEIERIIRNLPNVGTTRENVISIANNLVGKIAYGWGDKWDGSTIPSTLDCSGFTDYVYRLAGAGFLGAGTYGQWDSSYPISQSTLTIGDLGFLKPPSEASDRNPNHVGIYVGDNENGEPMFVHCQGGTGVVKTTAKSAGFYYFRRANVNFKED